MAEYFSWLWDWFASFFTSKEATMLILGLDNAGKTTLSHVLETGLLVHAEPTAQPIRNEFKVGKITCHAFDMGGHMAARRLWSEYFAVTNVVVFVIDTSDRDRLDEASAELHALLTADEIPMVPVMILGNKIDADNACSEEELEQALGIGLQRTGKDGRKLEEGQRPLELFMCSVARRHGYADGFNWLANYL